MRRAGVVIQADAESRTIGKAEAAILDRDLHVTLAGMTLPGSCPGAKDLRMMLESDVLGRPSGWGDGHERRGDFVFGTVANGAENLRTEVGRLLQIVGGLGIADFLQRRAEVPHRAPGF